jgi:hypothetical protein
MTLNNNGLIRHPRDDFLNIVNNLKKARRVKTDSYTACCPAHDDNSPSLSIDLKNGDQILFHCHSGCTQYEVMMALESMGLWQPKKKERYFSRNTRRHSKDELEYYCYFIAIYQADKKAGRSVSAKDETIYQDALIILRSEHPKFPFLPENSHE